MNTEDIHSIMERPERAAEEALQRDPTFHEALQALKFEIDSDPHVQATMGELQAAGQRVWNSLVPRINVKIRTDEGIVARPRSSQFRSNTRVEPVGRLTLELRSAAGAVIKNSRYCSEISNIINEAVGASEYFEEIVAQIERAGYKVLICLDLSSYAQIQAAQSQAETNAVQSSGSSLPENESSEIEPRVQRKDAAPMHLSEKDRRFLKGVGIQADEA